MIQSINKLKIQYVFINLVCGNVKHALTISWTYKFKGFVRFFGGTVEGITPCNARPFDEATDDPEPIEFFVSSKETAKH